MRLSSQPLAPHDHGGEHVHVHTHTHDGSTHTHVGGAMQAVGPARNLHLRGVLLPGDDEVDLWMADGVLHTEPIPDAVTLATGVFIMPGLVDAHCHIGLDAHGAVDDETAEQQAVTDRDAGMLLARDAGSPADTRWISEREDLPDIVRAGRHIARTRRYLRNYAAEVEPGDLVSEVTTQVANGDGWVKLVGDWIDRSTGDLEPSFPVEVSTAAIERAHEMGARVTAHCFGEQSASELVRAGIDGIEHGTGLDDETIELMAEHQVSLVPTMVNLENFPHIADQAQEKFPRYAVHMRDLYSRRFETIGRAIEAGVPVYAGTDAGGTVPHGLIGQEVEMLGALGGPEFALGAASWRARDWLGHPTLASAELVDGAPADIVVFAEDPRVHLGAVRHPMFVILKGRVVREATPEG